MKDDEYRALVEAGPAVVMVAKDDMLKATGPADSS